MKRHNKVTGLCLAVALGLTGAVLGAAEVTNISVSPGALSINQGASGTFTMSVDSIAGSVPKKAANPPDLTFCASWTIHDDLTVECTDNQTIALEKGRNYSQAPVALNEYRRLITVNVDGAVPCGTVVELPQAVTANAGSGVDFGGELLTLTRFVSLTVTCTVPDALAGCGHGYWKNHPSAWPAPYAAGTTIGSVFAVGSAYPGVGELTLEEALAFTGPGKTLADKARLLLKQAVAALFNAAHPSVNYELATVQDVIALVNDALASNNPDSLMSLEGNLERLNSGSPFCSDPAGLE